MHTRCNTSDWKSVQQSDRLISLSRVELVKWKSPGQGVWKINTDAATCYSNTAIGLGIVIGDMSGIVKVAPSLKLQAMFSALVTEAMAVYRGILLAIESGMVPFQIESNSLHVVELVNRGVPSPAVVGSIISLILFHIEHGRNQEYL
ncbi:hypothetical protein Ddye_025277 [Dipteronia dyeriana]|uniref:RNase H type-1 domain-containing protein n=1 Tax=Dipteronia dyeriana TaxID=168575 RepID=A0AAD9WTR5_9ROSI|nr:hypothetical protein Ddye_025277 [Dipteronia dyeriana]